jgi:hypothetical protein
MAVGTGEEGGNDGSLVREREREERKREERGGRKLALVKFTHQSRQLIWSLMACVKQSLDVFFIALTAR